MPKIVILWTDAAVWLMVLALLAYAWSVWRTPEKRQRWGRVFRDAGALASSIVLLLALGVTLLDSVHYRPLLPPAAGAPAAAPAYDTRTRSLLDALLADLVDGRESTYSKPLAYLGFNTELLVGEFAPNYAHYKVKSFIVLLLIGMLISLSPERSVPSGPASRS